MWKLQQMLELINFLPRREFVLCVITWHQLLEVHACGNHYASSNSAKFAEQNVHIQMQTIGGIFEFGKKNFFRSSPHFVRVEVCIFQRKI